MRSIRFFGVLSLLLFFLLINTPRLRAQDDEEEHGRPRKEQNTKVVTQQENFPARSIFFVRGIPGLTTKQKTKIEKFKRKMENDIAPFNKLKIEKSALLNALKKDDNSDQFEIDKIYTEISGLEVKIDNLRVKYLEDVRKLLDDKQKMYFDEHFKTAMKQDSIQRNKPELPPPPVKKKKTKNTGESSGGCPPSR